MVIRDYNDKLPWYYLQRPELLYTESLRGLQLELEGALKEAQGQLAAAKAAVAEGKKQAGDAQKKYAKQVTGSANTFSRHKSVQPLVCAQGFKVSSMALPAC